MASRLVVFACGNVSRGDDGLGPLLLARVEALRLDWLTAVEDYQLNIEHALDLDGADLALFIDAGVGTPAPYSFSEAAADCALSHSTHALEPPAVLATFARITGRAPPPAFVLTIRGTQFELGAALSSEASVHLERAWRFTGELLEEASASRWRMLARPSG